MAFGLTVSNSGLLFSYDGQPASIAAYLVFTARRSYASAVLGVVILSVRLSVRLSVCPSVRLSNACFVTNPKNLPAMFLYRMKGQSF